MARSWVRNIVWLVEADPDAAQAEEGVFLFRERQVGQRLVAADIQGADDQWTATAEHFGDGAVGVGLLVLAGSLIALVEQELGAQQADALAAGGDCRQGVVGVADIGDDFDPVAVAGLRRLHRGRQFLPAALGASGDLFAARGRLPPRSGCGGACRVRRRAGPGRRCRGAGPISSMPQIAGMPNERAMIATWLVAPPLVVQKPRTRVAVDRGDVGGRQVLGDQDGVLRHFDPLLLDPGEQAQDPPADVADVGRALAEQGIVEAFQLLGVAGERLPPRIGGAGAAGYAVERQIDEVGVFEKLLVGVEDLRLGGVAHMPLQFLDLGAGLGKGGVELAALVGGCAAFLVHFDHVMAVLEDPADGEAGGGRDAGDLVGVGRDGAGRFRRRCGGGLRLFAGLLAAAFRYQGSQGRDRLVGVGAGRLDRDDIALLGGQAHDRDQGLGVDLVVAPDQLNLGAEGLRRRRQHGGRPGVQSGGVRQGNAVGLRFGSGCRRVGDGYSGEPPCPPAPSVLQRQFQDDAAAGFDHPGCGGHAGDALDVGDDDLGQEAAGVAADPVGVEPDDGLTDLDRVADLDAGQEPVAAQHHGIEPDMDQDFDAFGGRDREGVMGVVELGHGP